MCVCMCIVCMYVCVRACACHEGIWAARERGHRFPRWLKVVLHAQGIGWQVGTLKVGGVKVRSEGEG